MTTIANWFQGIQPFEVFHVWRSKFELALEEIKSHVKEDGKWIDNPQIIFANVSKIEYDDKSMKVYIRVYDHEGYEWEKHFKTYKL